MASVKRQQPTPSTRVAADENVIITLDERETTQFLEAMEAPPREIPAILEFLRRRAPWD